MPLQQHFHPQTFEKISWLLRQDISTSWDCSNYLGKVFLMNEVCQSVVDHYSRLRKAKKCFVHRAELRPDEILTKATRINDLSIWSIHHEKQDYTICKKCQGSLHRSVHIRSPRFWPCALHCTDWIGQCHRKTSLQGTMKSSFLTTKNRAATHWLLSAIVCTHTPPKKILLFTRSRPRNWQMQTRQEMQVWWFDAVQCM